MFHILYFFISSYIVLFMYYFISYFCPILSYFVLFCVPINSTCFQCSYFVLIHVLICSYTCPFLSFFVLFFLIFSVHFLDFPRFSRIFPDFSKFFLCSHVFFPNIAETVHAVESHKHLVIKNNEFYNIFFCKDSFLKMEFGHL
jgi:hypothetical protein